MNMMDSVIRPRIAPVFLSFGLVLTLFTASAFPAQGNETVRSSVQLTETEKTWLKNHPTIRLAPDPEFQPIEFFDKNGQYAGITADFIKLITEKTGIHFEIVRCSSWDDVLIRIQKREVDILSSAVRTPQREKYLAFPPPYIRIPSVIIARSSVDAGLTLEKMTGMRVIMVSGYGYVDLIRNQHPGLEIELASNLKTALRKVSFGMADAFVGDLATASFYIESEGITNLKLVGETEPPNISGFAVRSDWPELSRILEKSVSLLTKEEQKAIFSKWIHLAAQPGLTWEEIRKLLTVFVGFCALVFIAFFIWTRQLKRQVTLRTEDLSKEIRVRQGAQEALKKSEAHLRTLLMTIPDLVWLKDPEGGYLACNTKFERFFGAQEAQIVGRTDYDFVPRELADFFRAHDQAAIEKGVPSVNEELVTFADDGHQEILETIKTPMYGSDGRLVGVLGIARNITDRKEAEAERMKMEDRLRQAHKMEAIGTLAGGIAHDFNNILAAMIGYADMARDHIPHDNPASSHLDKVLKAGFRAKELIRHILYFSRKEALKPTPTAVHQIIHDALELLRASIPATIDIRQTIDSRCGTVLADPIQIHQVMMNLCTNAAQAMDEKGGILEIRLTSVELKTEDLAHEPDLIPGPYLHLTVADTGIGIDPQNLDRIFDPYFTTKAVGQGSGMGLAVVHGIVKSHGGTIRVESQPGLGTTVHVYLPRVDEQPPQDPKAPAPLPMGREKLLVVDDEVSIADITGRRLEQLGYQVVVMTSSQEALDRFRSRPHEFDAVITDQTMPRLTGEELAKELLLIRPDIPILICTGYSSRLDEEKALGMGIGAFVMKPVDKGVLARTLRKLLDRTACC